MWSSGGATTLAAAPRYSGDYSARPGTTAHGPSAIRDFLMEPGGSIYCCCFLYFKKKKWNRNFKHMRFHTGNEIETTDTAEPNRARGGSAEEMLKGEVVKLMNKLTESAALQNRSVNCRLLHTRTHKKLSCVDTMVFICFHAAGARCWLARLDTGTFCLNPEEPWLNLQLQLRPLRFHGRPEPRTPLLEGISEGRLICPTSLSMCIIWSKITNFWSLPICVEGLSWK